MADTASSLAAKVQRLKSMRSIGALAHAARVKIDMIALHLLRLRFGFDPWHARSPDSARPYRRQLADLITGLAPRSVVEVGCGLGGLLARVAAERRHGYDHDPAVIRAARLLHGRAAKFSVGGFDQVDDRGIDVLIAVNWLHDFSPEQVEQWLRPLLPNIRYLLVDAIIPGSDGGYRFCHEFAFLNQCARPVTIQGLAEPRRHFILWEMVR